MGTSPLTYLRPSGSKAGSGELPGTGDFPIETQIGRTVGIQADMEKKPEGATVQEGQDSFDHYKSAGKVGHRFCVSILPDKC